MFRATQEGKTQTAPADTEEVARIAYELYEQRGRKDGDDWDDWFKAERIVGQRKGQPQAAEPAASRSKRW